MYKPLKITHIFFTFDWTAHVLCTWRIIGSNLDTEIRDPNRRFMVLLSTSKQILG